MNEAGITLKIAKNDRAEEIYALMKEVYEGMEDKSMFVCDDVEFVRAHIEKEGFTVVACDEADGLLGCFIVRFPAGNPDNLGKDIGFDAEEQKKVVHMESCVVSMEARGRGLQLAMLQFAENMIDKGKYRYFMATVDPNNPASFRTFEKNGYRLMATKEKYAGKIRRIYLKDLQSE
jgi:ribosomal protein S18 acetylase RimI-like enzyme